ncbi:ANTAR domain-containing response regulator [Candidatus Contubernalis alkaliaceticus]|uniref:ANTAR domain-containing response regulator n=1 Tax=Candidatus Contubernalis alkaliaceticus TaxID=338645 RepID=UPI001F4C4D44|nr:ANTAR domain-containing protein [Candidatus Contubernalis alkalaceticus]UNC91908.1 ANTAR domain-containing protein [Candidatus Contubernalis alkalaceticus]
MDTYRIFLAGASEDLNKIIPVINSTGHKVIGLSLNSSESLRQIKSIEPDLVIIDISEHAGDFIDLAHIISEDGYPVFLMIDYPQRDKISKMTENGFSPFIIKPINEEVLPFVIDITVNSSKNIQRLEREVKRLKKELVDRKVIEKAKGILMNTTGLSEREAFRRIQKQSMNKRVSMRKVSEAIIMAAEMEERIT